MTATVDAMKNSEAQPGLGQAERVVDTFVAPSKTFADIRRSASWWLPFLIVAIVSLAFAYAVDHQIGFEKVAEVTVNRSASAQQRMSAVPDAQQAQIMHTIATTTKIGSYATPAITLIIALISAGILMMSFNFGLGAKAKFKEYFAVWFYAGLPMALKYLLAAIAIFAGASADQFNIQNPVGTNIGYYLSSDVPLWLRTLLMSADVFTIWTVVLLIIGCAIVAGVKRSSAAFIVVGWWILAILGMTVGTVFQG